MVSKTLLVVLVAACSVHSLNAWPSDRKTMPGQAVMSREKFLGLLSKAVQDVTGEVAKSHQFVQDADAADRVGQATTKATEDVSDYTKWYTDALNEYAAHMIPSTVNTAPCVDSYMADKAGVEAYALNKAKALINTYMQGVRDTASNADTLLEKIASVQARGAAEAAKPDGEYGGDVEAILDAADGVVGKAVSNNGYINAVLSDGLDHAAEEAVLDNSDVSEDMRVLQGYAEFCMRKTAASA